MQKPELKRVNLFMEKDIVDVLDTFAAMNQRSRTFVIHELLRPSIPALKQLIVEFERLSHMTDTERLTALTKLTNIEEKLSTTVRAMPDHIQGATK